MGFTYVSFGGGVNSVAMCLGLVDMGFSPDAIIFSDTGGEKPETYEYLKMFSDFLTSKGFPAITVVREERFTLEQECLDGKRLPSLAYGFRSCSDKFKKRPIRRYLKTLPQVLATWEADEPVMQLIGFSFDEMFRVSRASNDEDKRFFNRFPLVEWAMDRQGCIDIIAKHGLAIPPKSSCFFCPAMKKPEILELREKHPALYARAIAMEQNAHETFTSIKGLGRSYSWADVEQAPASPQMELPCMCSDGDE